MRDRDREMRDGEREREWARQRERERRRLNRAPDIEYEPREHDRYFEEDDYRPRDEQRERYRDDTDEVRFIGMLRIFRQIEEQREELRELTERFADMLRRYPERQAKWEEFEKAGGVTADDFDRFLRGKVIRVKRQQRTKKHLRVVSSRPLAVKRIHRYEPGNDAA